MPLDAQEHATRTRFDQVAMLLNVDRASLESGRDTHQRGFASFRQFGKMGLYAFVESILA